VGVVVSERRLRRRSCERKRQFETQADAVDAMVNFLKRNPGHNVTVYQCRFGDHWHFGHLPGPRWQQNYQNTEETTLNDEY
jgi:hypothetical protein